METIRGALSRPYLSRASTCSSIPTVLHSRSFFSYRNLPRTASRQFGERNQKTAHVFYPHDTKSDNIHCRSSRRRIHARASLGDLVQPLISAFQVQPPTWGSSFQAMLVVFVLGAPLLLAGLTVPAVGAAFLLGAVTWRAFGANGLAIVIVYFLLGSAVTKVRLKQKEAEGIAEKRSGRRGPGSVWGSGSAGLACALLASLEHTPLPLALLRLGFVASFCTKLSDTSASEIGKAFGRTTYLATTFASVPRGTEGAVSLEGTVAGLCASALLAALAVGLNLVDGRGAALCLLASQVANYAESLLGATLQGRPGLEWLNNDVVNVLNITLGALLAIALAVLT